MLSSFGKGQIAPSVAGEQHVVFTKRLYQPDGTKRPCVWCHSAGGDATEPTSAANSHPLLKVLCGFGMPVISFDGKTSGLTLSGTLAATHWSNDGALSRLADAIAYLRANWGAHPTADPLIFGVSMGGLTALNYARSHPVAGLALAYPVTSLAGIHDGTGGIVGNAATSVETAYGGLSAYQAALPTHDPLADPSQWSSIATKMKMWYSDSDTIVGTANQENFAAGLPRMAKTVLPGAGHADLSRIDSNEFFEFIKGLV